MFALASCGGDSVDARVQAYLDESGDPLISVVRCPPEAADEDVFTCAFRDERTGAQMEGLVLIVNGKVISIDF